MSDQVTVPEVLHVDLVSPAPHLPLILCDEKFLATLKQVENQITSLRVTDANSAQVAADLQVRLTDAGKGLDKQRLDLVRPYNDQVARINAAAKAPAARIESAKSTIKIALTNYAAEVERKRIAAEKARQAEIARLENVARLEREAEQRKLDEIARQAEEARALQAAQRPGLEEEPEWDEPVEVVAPEKTETEKQLEAVKYAPVPVVVRPFGIKFRTTLIATVVDASKVPDIFIERVPKLNAIRAAYCVGYCEGQPIPECAGVAFEVKKEPVSDGRGRF